MQKQNLKFISIFILLMAVFPKARAEEKVKCVAVLPFENRSTDRFAGESVATLVSDVAMSHRRFSIMQPGTVTDYLEKQQGVRLASIIDPNLAKSVGQLLSVDALLMGSVEEYSYRSAGGKAVGVPAVSLSARLVSAQTGETLWSHKVRKGGEKLFVGEGESLSQAALQAVNELIGTMTFKQKGDEAFGWCGKFQTELDVDTDGILNISDRCPYQAEDYNGVDDEDGCPEKGLAVGELQTLVRLENGRLIYSGEIRFMEGLDTLLPHSVQLVKAIAYFLNQKKDLVPKVQVEGISLVSGTERYQELFAFSRAQTVKDTLIRNGVDPGRLSAIGYDAKKRKIKDQSKEIEFLIVE